MVEPFPTERATRAPVLFLGPGPDVLARDPGLAGAALARFGDATPRPVAVLAVSAEWQAGRELGVTSALLNHARGDDAWIVPGAPDLAARAAAALEGAGFRAQLDPARALDAGAWVPLRILFPSGDVPIVQVALPASPPAQRVAFGAALAPLRDHGEMLLVSAGPGAERGELAPAGAALREWVAARLAAGDVDGLVRWREEAAGAALELSAAERLDALLAALGACAPGEPARWLHPGLEEDGLALGSIAWAASAPVAHDATAQPSSG